MVTMDSNYVLTEQDLLDAFQYIDFGGIKELCMANDSTLPSGFTINRGGTYNVNGGKLALKDGVYSFHPYGINEPTVANKTCTCGVTKTYPNEPNLEFLHSDWCDLYKSNK